MAKDVDSVAVYHLLFLLVCFDVSCSGTVYYIKPSQNDSCLQTPCLTLSQFAIISQDIVQNETVNGTDNVIDLSLFFQPGLHILDRDLSLNEIGTLMLSKESKTNEQVTVQCQSTSGRFAISNAAIISITGLAFVNCVDNQVTQVGTLTIEDTLFQGMLRGRALSVTNCSILMSNCELMQHRASQGGAIFAQSSSLTITNCTFSNNQADIDGGVMYTDGSTVSIANSVFADNIAYRVGAVLVSYSGSYFLGRGSTFSNNCAFTDGGVMLVFNSLLTITDASFQSNSADRNCGVLCVGGISTLSVNGASFVDNRARSLGGVIYTTGGGQFDLSNSTFTDNRASRGGVFGGGMNGGGANITYSVFANNIASFMGAVIDINSGGSFVFDISDSVFTNNSANFQSVIQVITTNADNCVFIISRNVFSHNSASSYVVMFTGGMCSFDINNNTFTSNRADVLGGVLGGFRNIGAINISHCSFTNNSAGLSGIISHFLISSLNIMYTNFTHNSATEASIIDSFNGDTIYIHGSRFESNTAVDGALMSVVNGSIHIDNSTFSNNTGSLYIYNTPLILSGVTLFQNGMEPTEGISPHSTVINQVSGAITSFQSTVIFNGVTRFLDNQASNGGAILVAQSRVEIRGHVILTNNTALGGNGGAISLEQSVLEITGQCYVSQSNAEQGGGIYATSSVIDIYQPGSGLYFEESSRIFVFRVQQCSFNSDEVILVTFLDNYATYGGAVYIADDANSGACAGGNECYLQSLTQCPIGGTNFNPECISFNGNMATERGSNLFGGLLDRCTANVFAEVLQGGSQQDQLVGFDYLYEISNATSSSIASEPVRVCFCDGESKINCTYQPPPIKVMKGEMFTVALIAVDQVENPVSANIISSLSSVEGGFDENQQIQPAGSSCTELTFNVLSTLDNETVTLYPSMIVLLWQWLIRAPRWKIFMWTKNTKLNAFISTYHAPYNGTYRHWTGLLLLVRVVLYFTASFTVSVSPQTVTCPNIGTVFFQGSHWQTSI